MIGEYKRGGVGFCLVKLGTVYKTMSGKKGINGKELVLGDAEFAKERHAQTYGEVIQIPIALSMSPLYGLSPGFPAYGPINLPEADVQAPSDAIYSKPSNVYRFQKDIAEEVKIGDRIYFQWQSTFDKRNLIAQTPDKSVYIFKINYDQIYCAVRDGKIIPIGSFVLIDPEFETWESIMRPTYYDIKDKDGNPVQKPKDKWIQTKTAPKTVDKLGTIRHIGTPLKGEPNQLKVGMKVLYKPILKNLLEIEKEKYFILRANQILCYQDSVGAAVGNAY